MKILLLGASGRTGKLVLHEALMQGYEVNCVVRDTTKIQIESARLKLFEGDVLRKDTLKQAMQNCQIIISVLNISRHTDFPWSRLRTPSSLLSDAMKTVISLAEKQVIKRLIVCSAWGVSETKADLPFWFDWLIEHSNIKAAYKDHERQEGIIRQSDLDWTIVRPAGLINLKRSQKLIESDDNQPKPKLTINRITVAKYLIDAIKTDQLIKKAPVISARLFS